LRLKGRGDFLMSEAWSATLPEIRTIPVRLAARMGQFFKCHILAPPGKFFRAGEEVPHDVQLPGCARRFRITEQEAERLRETQRAVTKSPPIPAAKRPDEDTTLTTHQDT
jgi:hypothetical protein